ncbi:hypothetical protein ACJ73_05605 [Blastomyces percursus]|uniref:ferric-chelate reductase (NADPH) n=1 Tax=Blastomyces percursus TaxID=1658174 RepID=A0A1J9R3H0_9EURO|nr:hypothetical protein ACJ73_05605 [Blastomyces percursus]
MNVTEIYAIAAGGTLAFLIMVRFLSHLIRLKSIVSVLIAKHLTYPYLLDRHQLFGPWTRLDFLCHLLYYAINVFCLCFPSLSASDAGRRAGTLSLINMIFLFAGMHLSFVADLLGVSLRRCRGSHRAAGWMVTVLSVTHAVLMSGRTPFPLRDGGNLFALIGIVSLGLLSLLFMPFFRQLTYEIFLRLHQMTACLCVYAIWRHLPSHGVVPRLYLYISLGTSLVTLFLQYVLFLYRNGVFTSRGCPRALVTYLARGDDSDSDDRRAKPIKIRVALSRPLKIRPGQYINLWMRSVSWWSWVQSHPFTVMSWSPVEQSTLDLFIQPRHGLTLDLLRHVEVDHGISLSFPALVSGPHGTSESAGQYETVLVVASDFGVAPVIPYLKQLIHSYNISTSRTRRVHFVWQLRTLDVAISVQPWLNELLQDDVLDEGYILTISIYVEFGQITGDRMPFGGHERAFVYRGLADLQDILQTEVSGERIKRLTDVQEERGDVLVMGKDFPPQDYGRSADQLSFCFG